MHSQGSASQRMAHEIATHVNANKTHTVRMRTARAHHTLSGTIAFVHNERFDRANAVKVARLHAVFWRERKMLFVFTPHGQRIDDVVCRSALLIGDTLVWIHCIYLFFNFYFFYYHFHIYILLHSAECCEYTKKKKKRNQIISPSLSLRPIPFHYF